MASTAPRTLAVPLTRADVRPVLPAWIVAASWAVLVVRDGGYFMLDWAPLALVLLALGVGLSIGRGSPLPAPGPARVALALLVAIVALSGLSVLWAHAQATAWESADQLLLYLLMGWVLVLVPWTPRRALVLLTAWSGAVAVGCLAGYVDALSAADLGARFPEFRWSGPLGYANATGAIGVLALPGPLLLAARRDVGPLAQAAAVAIAAFLVMFSLLPQTRAALVGIPLVVIALLATGPERGRLLRRLLVVGIAVLAALKPIIAIDTAAQAHGPVRPAWDAAAWRILASVAAASLLMLALVALEGRVRLSPGTIRRLRRAAVGVAAVAAVAVAATAVASADRILDSAQSAWQGVRDGAPVRRVDGPRLLSVAPYQRSDYWRVAVDGVRSAPVVGLGAGGFERRYDVERRYTKHARFPHMIWLRVAGELGLVGLALLAALLVVAARAVVGRLRGCSQDERRVIAFTLALAVYIGFGATLDWLEEFPALVGPLVGAAAITLALAGPAATAAPRRMRHVPMLAGAGVVAAALTVAIALPWLSLRQLGEARALAYDDPPAADRALDRAASLNPLDPRPAALEAFIALEAGRTAAARAAFRRSLDVEEGWVGHFELALLDAAQGRIGEARRELAVARAQDRNEEIIATVQEMLDTGERIVPVEVNRLAQREPLYSERPAT